MALIGSAFTVGLLVNFLEGVIEDQFDVFTVCRETGGGGGYFDADTPLLLACSCRRFLSLL